MVSALDSPWNARVPVKSSYRSDTERPDVRAPVHWATLGLLGTHVGRSAQNGSGVGDSGDGRGVEKLRHLAVADESFREAEVEHLHRSVGPQLDIRRLEIAMDDSALVRRFEGFGDLTRDGQRLVERDWAAFQPLCQIVALDEFHHEGADAVGHVVQAVDSGDVGVIQRGEDFRFPLKPRHSFRISNEGLRQDLDGDIAIEPRVARPIHFTHPASPKGGENLVRTEARAIGQGHQSGMILVVAPRPGKWRETDYA